MTEAIIEDLVSKDLDHLVEEIDFNLENYLQHVNFNNLIARASSIPSIKVAEVLEVFYYWLGYQMVRDTSATSSFEEKLYNIPRKYLQSVDRIEWLFSGSIAALELTEARVANSDDLESESTPEKPKSGQLNPTNLERIKSKYIEEHQPDPYPLDYDLGSAEQGYDRFETKHTVALHFLAGYTIAIKENFKDKVRKLFGLSIDRLSRVENNPLKAVYKGIRNAVDLRLAHSATIDYFKQVDRESFGKGLPQFG